METKFKVGQKVHRLIKGKLPENSELAEIVDIGFHENGETLYRIGLHWHNEKDLEDNPKPEIMTLKEFNRIYHSIRTKKNYVKRDYETIGGMWTADTWENDIWKAQLLDEGCTQVLFNKKTGIQYIQFYDGSIKEEKLKPAPKARNYKVRIWEHEFGMREDGEEWFETKQEAIDYVSWYNDPKKNLKRCGGDGQYWSAEFVG
jgi:hypothetical protein